MSSDKIPRQVEVDVSHYHTLIPPHAVNNPLLYVEMVPTGWYVAHPSQCQRWQPRKPQRP